MAKINKNICLISSKKIKLMAKDKRIKISTIAEELGLKERALYNKLNYESSFSDTEVVVLTSIFNCSREAICKDDFELSKEELEFCKKHKLL